MVFIDLKNLTIRSIRRYYYKVYREILRFTVDLQKRNKYLVGILCYVIKNKDMPDKAVTRLKEVRQDFSQSP